VDFRNLKADLAIVAAYGLILPPAILQAPRLGCINIHASLLPRWRGASPIQHAIWHGDEKSGVTIMQMEEGLDTGPMLLKKEIKISQHMTATELHDQLSQIGAEALLEILPKLEKITAVPQSESEAVYAPLLKKEDGHINWAQEARGIDAQVRALNPWPGTTTYLQDKSIKIVSGKIKNESISKPVGTILNTEGDIACGSGTIYQALTVKPDGARAMSFSDAINGKYLIVGSRFE
jgi:methionyl-tRNA formyltransferase